MSDPFFPKNDQEVSDFIFENYQKETPIEINGSNSKKIGRIIQTSNNLSFAKLQGILEYFPEELYIKVLPGTLLSEVEKTLEKKNQMLGFEPNDLGYVYSGKSQPGTVGGMVSCNLSGPRRFKVGALRDHVLGFKAVNGKGEKIKSGGTVVKNVTGYDLSKIVTGSYGTLCALTEINLKVMPLPEYEETFIIYGLDVHQAMDVFKQTLDTSLEVSGAVYYPDKNANFFNLNDLKRNTSVTALRVEGPKTSVQERTSQLKKTYNNFKTFVLDHYQTKIFWKMSRNLEAYTNTEPYLLKISLPINVMKDFLKKFDDKNFMYHIDCGGNLLWSAIQEDYLINQIEIFCQKHNGHFVVYRASEQFRKANKFLSVSDNNLKLLSEKIKMSFDPKKILNPGKMYLGV